MVRGGIGAGTLLQRGPILCRQLDHKRRTASHHSLRQARQHGGSALPLAETSRSYNYVVPPSTTKALVALQRSILVIFFHLLADPTAEYTDLGSDFYQRRIDRARRTTHLLRQLHALGYDVQLTEAAA